MNRLSRIAVLAALLVIVVPFAAHAGHGHDDDGDQNQSENQGSWHHDNGWHKGWYKHHGHHHDDDDAPPPSNTNFPGQRVCDKDGDECHTVAPEPMVHPNWDNHYVCDHDGDDCHWTNGGGNDYWQQHGGHDYGAPYSWYQAAPPSSYNLAQRRDWLAARRKRAMYTIKSMRERGDSEAAGRMAEAVQGLDRQINAIDKKLRRGY